jgi:DNA primase
MKLPIDAVDSSLKVLGINVLEERGDELIALCPGHKERTGHIDKKPSWSINTETGVHYCFSCHYKGNLYTLYLDIRGRDTANDFWSGMSEYGVPIPEGYQVSRDFQTTPTMTLNKKEAVAMGVPESQLALYVDPPDWALEARRITKAGADFYGIRWSEDHAAWVIPLRDPNTENLIGYQLKGQLEKIVLNKPAGISKKHTLFGIVEVKDRDSVVVVESPLDAVLLHDIGYAAVAICGSHLSEQQLDLLRGFDYVQIVLDNDDAGRIESERLRRLMPGFKYRVVPYKTDKKDFGEMEYDDIEESLAGF